MNTLTARHGRELLGAWATYDRAVQTLDDLEEQERRYVQLRAAIAEIIANETRKRAPVFVAEVQKYMPEGWAFSFLFNDARGTAVFRVGVKTPDGTMLNSACGAQWVAIQVALASALCRHPETDLVVVEERNLTAAVLAKVLDAWRKAPMQIIITGTHKLKKKQTKGWTVIDLGWEDGDVNGDVNAAEVEDTNDANAAEAAEATTTVEQEEEQLTPVEDAPVPQAVSTPPVPPMPSAARLSPEVQARLAELKRKFSEPEV